MLQSDVPIIVCDDNNVIPFSVGSVALDRRKSIGEGGPLPFRPRRISDYAWLDEWASAPVQVFIGRSIFLSGVLHVTFLFLLCHFSLHFYSSAPTPIEVDLTGPYEMVTPALRGVPNGKKDSFKKESRVQKASETETISQVKPLVHPSSPAAASDASIKQQMSQQSVPGTQEGSEVALASLTTPPRLLNRRELSAGLRRFYPEEERRAGHEADVIVVLHISAAGDVTRVDIVKSAGEAFDRAAMQVAQLFRFSPARLREKSVAVRLDQTISFHLEN